MTNEELKKLKKDELIDIVSVKSSEIGGLKRKLYDTKEELDDALNEINEFETISNSREGTAEKAFNAGFKSCLDGCDRLRAWLNYRIEAGIND